MKIKLDKYQYDAVKINSRNSIIIAAPGSGKTTVIINRVNELIVNRQVKIGHIIIITFTRAAAENMKNRYKKVFNKDMAPFFGTFHGLFYKILLRENYNINILEGGAGYGIIKSVLTKHFDEVTDDKIKEIQNDISRLKTSMGTLEEYKPQGDKDIFIECLTSYEGYKQKNNLWDFDDLSVEVIKIFSSNQGLLNRYRDIFKYVLVDEFQDCDELQIRFLSLINEGGSSLFAVGDEDQCIYSFRGSQPEYMVTFDKTFKGGEKVYLKLNYRSKKNIVDVSKKLILNNKKRNKKEILSFRETDGTIQYSTPYNETTQGEEIAKVIQTNGCELTDNAVLYRTNMEARGIIDVFTRKRIPFKLLDKGYNFFEHFICKDMISYLRLAIDQKDKKSFLNIINKPFRYISKATTDDLRKDISTKSPFDVLIDKKDTPPFQAKNLDDLRKDINYLNKVSLGSAIQFIISNLKYIDYLKEYGERYHQSIDELEEILEEFKSAADGFRTIIEFLGHVEKVGKQIEEGKVEENGVILSTIHGVKGMEFKNVFLINCDEETIPHKSSMDNNIEEERRLFYVGITRAIDNLYLYSPKSMRGNPKEASRFIKEACIQQMITYDTYGIEVGDPLFHRTYGEGEVNEIKDGNIKIDFKDGIERGFKLNILMENNLLILMK
ncbi:MAG: ATP-dependent helicase [Clostridium sp.]